MGGIITYIKNLFGFDNAKFEPEPNPEPESEPKKIPIGHTKFSWEGVNPEPIANAAEWI